MSKRLVRLASNEVQGSVSKLQGKDLNVVVYSGQTYFGQMISFSEGVFILKDFRSHEHRLNLSDIEKIIYDQDATW